VFTSVAVSAPASLFAGIRQRVVFKEVQSPKYLFPREEFTINKYSMSYKYLTLSQRGKKSHYAEKTTMQKKSSQVNANSGRHANCFILHFLLQQVLLT